MKLDYRAKVYRALRKVMGRTRHQAIAGLVWCEQAVDMGEYLNTDPVDVAAYIDQSGNCGW